MSALVSPSLFDAPVEGEGAVVHPGQWRLARMEVVNWGTFSNFHTVDVSRKGLLITGESGSGKSSLLDAAACVLTPPRALRLNAAAQSEGVRAKDRTLYSYIRGAWNNQTDETGEISSSYLRDRTATWSGVLLRYECGLARDAINLVALYHLRANSTGREGLSSLYVVAEGDRTLLDFRPYVENGLETKALNRDMKGATGYREHAPFAANFRRRMGIQSDKALELLHRTQAAKNFGSLDDLFRKFMLDDPKTFAQKDVAVEQFSALRQAYDGVVDQRNQRDALEPLVEQAKRHDDAEERQRGAQRLQDVLGGYTEQQIIAQLERQQEQCRRAAQQLAADVERAEAEYKRMQQQRAQAQAALDEKGGFVLDSAEKDLLQYEQQLRTVQSNRSRLEADLKDADPALGALRLPDTSEEWSDLVSRVQRAARELQDERERAVETTTERYANLDAAKREIESLDKELQHLRKHPTNIPRELDEVRLALADDLGIDAVELPFVGELLDVPAEFSQWRGAIERVLNSQAKTLLVAHDYVPAVRRYVDTHHLGLRFEFEDVPADVEVPQDHSSPRSLVRRVRVSSRAKHPEYAKWVNRLIRTKFDYICVDSPDELGEHRQALTKAGQIKHVNRHIKDDRHRVDDRSRWILGAVNDEKIEELVAKRKRREQDYRQARELVQEEERRRECSFILQRLGATLRDAAWSSYDEASARRDRDDSARYVEELRRGTAEMNEARRLRDEADAHLCEAERLFQDVQLEKRANDRKFEDGERQLANHRGRLKGCEVPDDRERAELKRLFDACARRKSAPGDAERSTMDGTYQTSNDVSQLLVKRQKDAAEELRRSRSAVERTIAAYRGRWKTESADLGDGFEARGEYLGIYRRIVASGLPSFEREFLKVLNDFSQDQITVIATTIRDALREVKDKIRLVNRSLALSEYSPGIHLQIDVRECRSQQANTFLSDLRAIAQDSYDNTDLASAEARYQRTAAVMRRLSSDEPADRRWRDECLDTRRHAAFRAKEVDAQGNVQNVHDSDAGLSGGQKQKLVIFCLAAALRYQLADEDEPVPSYGTVMLDEAFDKADHRFAATAMDIFEAFGFQMVLATPMKLLQTADDHIGGVAYVHCHDRRSSTVQLLSFEEDEGAGGGAADGDAADAGGVAASDDDPAPEGLFAL